MNTSTDKLATIIVDFLKAESGSSDLADLVNNIVKSECSAQDSLKEGYEEHAKLYRLHGRNTVIQEFLEWLQLKDIELCIYAHEADAYFSLATSPQQLVAEFCEIDQDRISHEKGVMLQRTREVSKKRG